MIKAMIEPTSIYVRAVKSVAVHYKVKRVVHAMAHITGGGLLENPPRVLPPGCALKIERTWDVPAIFPWLQKLGEVPNHEMFRVFNMGIGYVFFVAEFYAESLARLIIEETGIKAWVIGEVVKGDGEVQIEGVSEA